MVPFGGKRAQGGHPAPSALWITFSLESPLWSTPWGLQEDLWADHGESECDNKVGKVLQQSALRSQVPSCNAQVMVPIGGFIICRMKLVTQSNQRMWWYTGLPD